MHHQHVWMPWRPTSMWKHWEDKVNGKRPGQFIGRGTIKEFKIYLNSCRYDSQWGRFLVFHFLKLQLVTLFQWSIGKQRWTISLKPAGRNLPQTMGIFRLLRANRWSVLWLPVTNYPVWSSIKERIDWCPVLMLSSTQAQTYPQRGSEWGIPGYWATLYLRLTLITLPIYYSFCLSGCPSVYDADSGFIPVLFFIYLHSAEAFTLGHLEG